DNACTACRLTMSRADVGELLAGPPLTTCPQCRRLLVVPA
ncbi:MAG: C4-type zinc ribbon domain-containing protein, partial [Nitriliruptoraceae bacterium]